MKRMIMTAVVLLALIPTVLIGFIVNHYIQSSVKTDKLDMLAGTAHMMSVHLDKYYASLILDVEEKAEMEKIKDLLLGESRDAMSAADLAVIERILKGSVGVTILSGAVIDQNGKTVYSTEPGEAGLMLDKTELFRSIMNGKSSYTGLVTGKESTDNFEIAVPVKSVRGENLGLVKQTIKLDFLATYLDTINKDGKEYSFLIRDNGYMIDQSGKNQLVLYNEYQDNSSLEKLVADFKQGMLKEGEGTIEFEYKGADYIGSYERIESIRCVAVVAMEKNYLFGNNTKLNLVYSGIILIALLAIALGGYFIGSLYTTPLKMMNGTLKKIAAGDLTSRCYCKGSNEYMELCNNINQLADRYQKSEKELRLSSRIDNLTHLPNQNAIYEVLDTLLYKHPNQALVLLDLEGFKDVNDNLGYDIGDRILMEVGDILRELPQHVCYPSRLGGAEFIVFVTNWTAPKYPEKIAEKIIGRVEEIRFIDEIHVDVSANIGIEYVDGERTDKKKLIKYANIAMHKARSIGRNSYFVHYPYMRKE